jgi:Na+/melibiose symporter-like transporter
MSIPLSSTASYAQSEKNRANDDYIETPVALKELLAYAGPALPVQMILLVTVIYLPSFYAIQRGLSMSAVGAMFFAARLWDTVTDTFIGGLSDSTVTRWGRRKPWVAGATPFLLVAAYFLFIPPVGGASSLYLGCWLFLFYLGWTAVQIPYLAWGAELSNQYIERSRVIAFREALGTIGVMLATALPLIFLSAKQRELSGVLRVAFFGVLVMLPLAVLVAVTVTGVERTRNVEVKFTWRVMVDTVRTNPLFVRFLIAQLFFSTAWNIFLASIVIIVEYALNLRGQYLSLVLLMNLTATLCMPLAIRLGRSVDKHRALAIAMLGFVVFYIVLSAMPPNHYEMTAAAFLFLGVCWAPVLINMHSMIPDLVDVGLFRGQASQAGIYMAIYYVVVKMGMALGVGVGLPLLEAAGLHIKEASTVSGQRAITWVSLYLPVLMTLPAIWLFWTYALTRKRHNLLRKWLDGRARLRNHQ